MTTGSRVLPDRPSRRGGGWHGRCAAGAEVSAIYAEEGHRTAPPPKGSCHEKCTSILHSFIDFANKV